MTCPSAEIPKLADKPGRVWKAAMRRMRRRGKHTIGRSGELVLIDGSKFGHKRKVGHEDHTDQSNIVTLICLTVINLYNVITEQN